MWITSDVELPQPVIDAHAAGRLVFFIGAGASVDAPSSLPLFDELAHQLAGMARVPFDDATAIDFFLGSMPENFDTHTHARDLIAREGSTPNSTHAALVRLASAIGPLRVVTTNFDDHLSSAATTDRVEVRNKWFGPALPLGDDFAGIVHLHGSVLNGPQELVLTDSDFGRAYLTHAWATRFLLPMFQKFTVLFVGYSHDDPIMRYLALGLPSGTPRYAFTSADRANDPKWTRLGVETIRYPVQGNDHGALVAALEAWDARARMGQTDHRSRMAEIVAAGTTLTPVDRDHVTIRLQAVDGAREFAVATAGVDSDRQLEWLRWVENLPEFKSLFTGREDNEASSVLGNWFSQTFIASSDLHGAALQTVQRLGQKFSDGLFRMASWTAEQLSKKDADAGRRWKVFLATSVHGHSAPIDTQMMLSYDAGELLEHISVLRAATRPFLVLKRRWLLDDSENQTVVPDAEVTWTAAEESLTSHVLKAVEAAPPGDLKLGAALEESLNAAYDLLDAYHGGRQWDGLSFGRSAIEPHGQDQFRDPIDAIIDGLRAYGEKASLADPELIERWWRFERALFQRLSLHLLVTDGTRTPEQKIEWLLDRSVLYETDLKHEVYRVLETTTREASDEIRERLLIAAQVGPELSDDLPDAERHSAYAKYNLFVWLAAVAPDWVEARDGLAVLQAANPDFAPREQPDFDHWMTSGTWGGKLPMEPDAFAQALVDDPSAAMDDLLSRDYSERHLDQPEWHDALSLVRRIAETRPELGEQVWTYVDARADLESKASDLREAIVEGWAKASLEGLADTAVTRVSSLVSNPSSARSVSKFLLEQVRAQIESEDTPALATMRKVALDLWRLHGNAFTHSEDTDVVSAAPLYLNSWPGDLAQYWTSEIDRRWRKHRDDWSGLNEEERDALSQLIEGAPHTRDATQPAFASQLFFLFAADPDFTTERILPLFRDDATARLAWNPYLHHPRYNDKLLAAGLLDSVLAEWDRLADLGGHGLEGQFFGLVASIVSFAGITPEQRQELLDKSVLAADGAHAADFAEIAIRLIRADKVDGSEVWNRWLHDHLAARLNGIPRIASPEELARWVDAVPYLGPSIEEALDCVSGRGVGLGEHFRVPDFPDGVLVTSGAALVRHYAERIRNSTPSGYLVPHQVRKLIETIRNTVGEASAQELTAAAAERGFMRGDMGE